MVLTRLFSFQNYLYSTTYRVCKLILIIYYVYINWPPFIIFDWFRVPVHKCTFNIYLYNWLVNYFYILVNKLIPSHIFTFSVFGWISTHSPLTFLFKTKCMYIQFQRKFKLFYYRGCLSWRQRRMCDMFWRAGERGYHCPITMFMCIS